MPYRDDPATVRALSPLLASRRPEQPSRRIVIISASVGAGHDGAAAELARCLEADGFRVERHDFLDLLPARLGSLLSATYHRLLDWAPVGYQRIYAATEHTGRTAPGVRALLRSAERRTLRAISPDTCAVVSTYPGASQVLGRLRQQGRLTVPAITYLTDFSVHSLWVAPGIDTHLAVHEVPAGQARAQGAAAITVTGPLVATRFAPATEAGRRAARARWGLPEQAPLALLVAGSWGVGPIEEVAAEIQGGGAAVPVVVCGRNQALAERMRRNGVQHVHGWVEDMPALMSAADVLVQNAGGLTSLEAFASGLPVASYRCIPGHGQTNAAALQEAGLAAWIRESADLHPVLTELMAGPLGRQQRVGGLELFGRTAGPAQAVAAAAGHTAISPRTASARHPVLRAARRPARPGMPVMAAAVAATLAFGIGAPLAEAYGDSPARLASLARLLGGDRR
ncbi:glycosyltransferase [Streptomyces sioyaensis]|uniref:MGDG synthase family glycosyltransferase n=1 Tax=Streptomyces sioyaensis TaxID=67364 RepID=UPI0037B105C0